MYASGKVSDLEVEPVDSPSESKTLVVMSIESEDLRSGGIPHVRLGGMSCHAGDTNRLGNGADALSYQVDGSRGPTDGSEAKTDASDASNSTEMAGMSCGNDAGTYLIAGDAKRSVEVTDGVGSHADAPSGDRDVPSVQTKAIKPEKATETISIPQKKLKPPDLPGQSTEWHPDKPDGCGNHQNMLSMHTDVHCIGNERETAKIKMGNVRMGQIDSKPRNSPETHKIATAKPIGRWRKVSAKCIDGTYCGTCLLRHWTECLRSDGLRALERQLRQMLRARRPRELVMVVAMETVTTETETAQLAAAALTQNESKQCGWLEKVSICAGVEETE